MTQQLELLLGPMLRYVGETVATIFVETSGPCSVTINGIESPTFSVSSHHYALVMVEGLEPASITEYSVFLNKELKWPPAGSQFPQSVIRTLTGSGDTSKIEESQLRILVGSCRAAAPHVPPFSLSATDDPQGLGVDSLRAHGLRMLTQPTSIWPDLLLLLGDQVYADEPSPKTKTRIRARRRNDSTAPADLVLDFDDYSTLYHEAWGSSEVERWVLSVVPSAMIFDDHDMIDDWNISASWVRNIRAKPWWNEHVVSALMSYWIYQHLGNLSPETIREEGLLARLLGVSDGEAILREWALESEQFTPVEGGYRFSFVRDLGRTRIVVIDCRNARVLEPERWMVGREEWAWVDRSCRVPVDHLFIATSVPVLVTGGIHGLQVWNAALCRGAWGRPIASISERLRRFLDLEDWPAFERSFIEIIDMIREIATRQGASLDVPAPATIAILSGDIHFSYVARATFPTDNTESGDSGPDEDHADLKASRVYQLVSSPIRQTLKQRERRIIRFALSRAGLIIGRLLQRSVKSAPSQASWTLTHGPEFANEMGVLTINGREVEFVMERARPDEHGDPILEEVIRTDL